MRIRPICLITSLGVICLSFNPAPSNGDGQIAKLLPGDGAANDLFGAAVAVSGSTAIAGAYFDDVNGNFSGSAYLFDTLTGAQIAKLLPDDGAAGDNFGFSVAISGSTAIVGAFRNDDNGNDSGAAYLFDTLSGVQIAKLLPNDGALSDFFGQAVGISGSIAIVGAFADDDNGSASGSAYLFDTLTGMQIAKLLPNDGAMSDAFGRSVAISGGTAIVGAAGDDANGSGSGAAYLFDTLSGVQIAKLLSNDGGPSDQFGISVAISGNIAIVGAFADDANGSDSGSAYLFNTLSGVQMAKLLPSDGASLDLFGRSVAISGSTAIVGAGGGDDNGLDSGSAYLFNALSGVQIAKLLPNDGSECDFFGSAVAISGSTAVVGAFGDDAIDIDSGSAYLFDTTIIQASVTTRNGSGLNATILSRATDPVLGSDFITELDCTGHAPSFAALRFQMGASSGFFLAGGELLVDLTSPLLLSASQAHTGGVIQFSLVVPNDSSLIGQTASVQGVVLGAPSYELSNALDIVVGL